jgi:4-amino-4-deoxy-L-arabinose transferase-like glycosyltransferase
MVALSFLLLVAFGMRLYRLADMPPGLFHDEAYNTLDAQAIAEGLPHPRFYDSWEVYARTVHPTWPPPTTRFPVFLEGNYGREALFHYLGALFVAMVGPRVWALRLVAAFAGVVAVATTWALARELFADEPERAARLALLATAVSVGIYSLLAFSRLGLRIILLVTMEGLTIALWWRASRDGGLRWWLLAGLLLGLSQYTYIPSRLLLLIAPCPALVWIVRRPQRRSQLERGTLLGLLVALAVMAPLVAFFVRYPAYLTLRADVILADAPESGLAMRAANLYRILQGLVWRGDPNPILNLPDRPALDVVQAVFFVAGLVACLRRVNRLPYQFLPIWAALMHAPSLVAGVAPTFGRSIGGMLPVAIIVATGVEATWGAVVTHWPRLRTLATGVVLGSLAFSIGLTGYDYFYVWARLPDLPHILHEEMAVIGRYIGALPDDVVVYMTPTQKYFATLLLAMESPGCLHPHLPGGGRRDRPRDFYSPVGLLPAGQPGRETAYLILEGDETSAGLLEETFPEGCWDVRNGIFAAYRVPATADRARSQSLVQADFAGVIQLAGFDLHTSEVHPGDTLSVRLTWQALAETDRHYTAFVHLLGPDNPASGSPLWAQDDHEPGQATYATDRWFSGEVVMDVFHLQVPADAPPGRYTLTTGFYDPETMARLPVTGQETDHVLLAQVEVVGR